MRGVIGTGVAAAVLSAAATIVWVDVLQDQHAGTTAPAPVAVSSPTPVVWYAPPIVEVAKDVDVDQAEVAAFVERVVNDPRGWRTDLDRFTFRIVKPGYRGTYGFGQDVGRAFVGEDLAVMTADAWVRVGTTFGATGGTLNDQRTQVLLHEMGHLLGHYNHTECPGSGPAPVMRSNTYGLGNCDLNVWPNP
ncbi:DUF3152 domain-containing protein [Micromonospora tarensis]|uniref:DUF3152 domain-containing protein n=1 Tax=Micromonospora tarensis TaxID=2806100 RepID=A0ABS1YA75_9ACTN|nr:DUF3152 domain-containing protein [Micromonospora tarensis]MBM0274141.1 DUF3152 domain-containing protein [Micromonospora tarensis]